MGRREVERPSGEAACALAQFAWRRVVSRASSLKLSADRAVMLAAVRCDPALLRYAAPKLLADRQIILAAVRQDASYLKYASAELRADREIVLAAVKKLDWRETRRVYFHPSEPARCSATFLKYAAPSLLADRDVILAAVQQDALSLQYASAELRADREIVLAAVKRGGYAAGCAVEFAAPELLKAELPLILAALHQDMTHLKFSTLRADDYVLLAATRWAAEHVRIRCCSEIRKLLEAWDPPDGKGPFPAEVRASLEKEWTRMFGIYSYFPITPSKISKLQWLGGYISIDEHMKNVQTYRERKWGKDVHACKGTFAKQDASDACVVSAGGALGTSAQNETPNPLPAPDKVELLNTWLAQQQTLRNE